MNEVEPSDNQRSEPTEQRIEATRRRLSGRIRYLSRHIRAPVGPAREGVRDVGRQLAIWGLALPPQIFYALWRNRKLKMAYEPSVDKARIRRAVSIDKDASIALWQADTDRLNGLAAKAGALLAADALIAAGLATQTQSRGWVLLLCVVCIGYLVSGSVAACLVQMPMPRQFVVPEDVLDGNAERRMVEVVAGNESLGIRIQNLVSVGVRDTFISLLILLLVFGLNLWQ
jgi:hypothetical protein